MKYLLPIILFFALAVSAQQVDLPAGGLKSTTFIGPTDSVLVSTGITARSTRLINTSNLLESIAAETNWSARVKSGGQATNAINLISSNTVAIGATVTNLDFLSFAGDIQWLFTNVAGRVDVFGFIQGTTTNNITGTAGGATNDSAGNSIFLQFQNGTNQSLKIGLGATNEALLIGLNGTNEALLIGQNGTNETTRQAQNGTNQSLLIGLNATNNDVLSGINFTNGLGGALSNLAWNIGLNGTNDDILFGGNGTNWGLKIGLNATNDDFLLGANITNGAIANLSNLVAIVSANATNEAWLIGLNGTNETTRQFLLLGLNATNNDILSGQLITNGLGGAISNLAWTIGLNGTNNVILLGQNLTNGAINNLSNLIATISANATNQSLLIGANGTNESLLIGANGTNQSWLIGLHATNNDIAVTPTNGIVMSTNSQLVTVGLNAAAGTNALLYTNASGTVIFNGVPPAGAGSGSVTSVGLAVPGGLSVLGSPVTTSGTLQFIAANTSGFWKDNGSGVTSWSFDGSGLLNLNGSQVTSGTIPDSVLPGDVTRQGNSFNGASQLVQLNGSDQYPALDGSLITNLNQNAFVTNSQFYVSSGAGASFGIWGTNGAPLLTVSNSLFAIGTNTQIKGSFAVANPAYGDYFFIDAPNHAFGFVQTNNSRSVWTNGTRTEIGTNTDWVLNEGVTGWMLMQGAETNSSIISSSGLGLLGIDTNGARSVVTITSPLLLSAVGALSLNASYVPTIAGLGTNEQWYGTNTFGTNTAVIATAIDGYGNYLHYGSNLLLTVQDNHSNVMFQASGLTDLVTMSNLAVMGLISSTNGIASYSTNNAYSMATTGFTNTSTKTLRIFGFTGTSVQFSNQTSATHFSIGTTAAPGQMLLLDPKETLVGTGCAAAGIVDF